MIDEKKLNRGDLCDFCRSAYCTDCFSDDDFKKWIESQPKVGEWIPCSERLPECEWGAETKALLYQRKTSNPTKGDICTGYFGRGGSIRDNYFRTYADTTEGVDASDVIAWMPLPEPYKEEGAE